MTNDGRDEKDGMDPEGDEALWSLLGQQPPSTLPSPYFTRRVLREVALTEQKRTVGWRMWLRRWLPGEFSSRRMVAWSGAVSAACVAVLLFVNRPAPTMMEPALQAQRMVVLEPVLFPVVVPTVVARTTIPSRESMPVKEVEVIADLDNILQREENRLWTEDTARF